MTDGEKVRLPDGRTGFITTGATRCGGHLPDAGPRGVIFVDVLCDGELRHFDDRALSLVREQPYWPMFGD